MNNKDIVVEDARIACFDAGGDGPALVFIHGNSASSASFERLLDKPIGGGLRKIAIDLPGHGASGDAVNPSKTYTLPGYAAAVNDALNNLDVGAAIVVGHSLGGHVALELAAIRDNVLGVMAIGTPPISCDLEKAMGAFIPCPLMEVLFKGELSEAEQQQFATGIYAPNTDIPAITGDHVRRTDPRCRENLGASVGAANFMDEVAFVGQGAVPLALVVGRDDPIINVDYMRELDIKALWRDEVIVVDGGHAPFWDHADQFASLLDAFIASLR